MKYSFLIFIVLFAAQKSLADTQPKIDGQYGCSLKASEIEATANEIFKENGNVFPLDYLLNDVKNSLQSDQK